VSPGFILSTASGRFLHSADIHSVDANRDAVVGRVLDQQGLGAGTHCARRHDRVDDDHATDDISQ